VEVRGNTEFYKDVGVSVKLNKDGVRNQRGKGNALDGGGLGGPRDKGVRGKRGATH